MSDRELLELAAKAAGFDGQWGEWPGMEDRHGISCGFWIDDMSAYWNPLQDDGDALRLAVSLGLVVDTDYNIGAAAGSAFLDMACSYEADNPRRFGADRNAATRRAIVRAAAEIGRAMS